MASRFPGDVSLILWIALIAAVVVGGGWALVDTAGWVLKLLGVL